MRQLYWCDKCYKENIDENEITKRIYFSCYSNQQWASHLKSKKHLKFCKEVEEDNDKVLCKFCDKSFTKEGYEIHSKRNNKLWELKNRGGYKNLKCNNFFTNAKRYETLEDYIAGVDPNKPKLKRTKVGKYSPITCSVREPNKNKLNETTLEDYEKDIIQPEHVQTLWNISAYLLLDATPPYAVLESMSMCVLEHTHAYEDLYIHSTRAVRSLLINRVCGLQTNKRIAETLETTFCRLIGKPSYGCCADTWPRGRNAVARILQLNRHSGTALSLSTDVQHEFCREIVSTDTVVNATIAFEESARKHFASTPFQPDSQTLRIRSIFKLERYCINTGNMCIRLMSRN